MRIIFWVIISLILGFLIFPLIVIVASSFSYDEIIQFPPRGFTLRWFSNLFCMDVFSSSFRLSFILAFLTMFLSTTLGMISAYYLLHSRSKMKKIFEWIVISPLLVPEIVIGFSILRFFVSIFNNLNPFLILLFGHTVVLMPYTTRIIFSSMKNMDPSLEESARNLGANKLRAFFEIVLPNLKSSIMISLAFVFIASFNNIPISIFLTTAGYYTLPIQLLIYSEYYFDPTVSAVSTMILMITLPILFIVEKSVDYSFFR